MHDMAALVPIVTEAGGRFTALDGTPGPWGGNAVATNGILHDEVLAPDRHEIGRPAPRGRLTPQPPPVLRREGDGPSWDRGRARARTAQRTGVPSCLTPPCRSVESCAPRCPVRSRRRSRRAARPSSAPVSARPSPCTSPTPTAASSRTSTATRFIDLGSGIAVTSVGDAAPRRRRRACRTRSADFTHTCFMVTPYEGTSPSAEQLTELTPGDHEKRTVLFNSGAEAVENAVKVARLRHRPRRRRRLRPRLPRPHQPHHGADRQGDAVQDAASARSRRRSTGCR